LSKTHTTIDGRVLADFGLNSRLIAAARPLGGTIL
jgi:hypothetical protein